MSSSTLSRLSTRLSTDPNLKGDIVTGPPAQPPDPHKSLIGNITLIPLHTSHAEALYPNVAGPENDYLYTYIPSEGFHDLDSFRQHLARDPGPNALVYTIFTTSSLPSPTDATLGEAIGQICFLNVNIPNRSIEIGYVVYSRKLQKTAAATEVNYLLMKYAFEELGFLRVEWKCNSHNEPSRRAARRLGFVEEGVFRKHMIVKGRRRDTAWYSCIDDEWNGGVKQGLEKWLAKENFDDEGKQIKKLEELRGELKA